MAWGTLPIGAQPLLLGTAGVGHGPGLHSYGGIAGPVPLHKGVPQQLQLYLDGRAAVPVNIVHGHRMCPRASLPALRSMGCSAASRSACCQMFRCEI